MNDVVSNVPDNRNLDLFPGEYGLPFLGKTIQLVKDTVALCYDHYKRFGPVSKLEIGRAHV